MEVMIALGAACLLIRCGVALYGTGLVRSKNAAASVLRAICDLCVAALAFWAIGGAILTQSHSAIFSVDWRFVGFRAGEGADLFFLTTVVLVGTGVAGSAMAERAQFFPLCCVSILLAAIVIPVGANWAWTGWLRHLGFIDPAGGSWLHASAAMCAAVGAAVVGARTGKYHRDGSASTIPGHNVPLAAVGALTMLVGWIPYVAGCLLLNHGQALIGQAATTTLLCAAAAGFVAILLGRFRYGKPDVILTLIGFLGGLVAITAAAGRVGAPSAVLIGAVAGVIVPVSAIWIDLRFHLDDPLAVIATHGVGGAWGTIAAGLLIHGSASHRLHQAGVQIVGLAAIGLLSAVLSFVLFALLRLTVRLRANEDEEFEGLDLAEHDIGAYPDFQQTMIKSYDLREA